MARRDRVHVVVDDDPIARGDWWAAIEPVWWSANIYDGPGLYEVSLSPFSKPQRFVFAVHWYLAEVNNGGHLQFYSNPTGIVWQDALAGLEALDVPKAAQILKTTSDRLGGSPSLEREERQEQLNEYQPDFDDCDKALYKLQKQIDFGAKMLEYIRANPSDFHFSGTIERPVLPSRGRT